MSARVEAAAGAYFENSGDCTYQDVPDEAAEAAGYQTCPSACAAKHPGREHETQASVMPMQNIGCRNCHYNNKYGTIYCKEHRGW